MNLEYLRLVLELVMLSGRTTRHSVADAGEKRACHPERSEGSLVTLRCFGISTSRVSPKILRSQSHSEDIRLAAGSLRMTDTRSFLAAITMGSDDTEYWDDKSLENK